MSDLHYMPATEALRLFRSRDLSPVELVTAVIARAEEVEPAINAFAETRYAEALVQARAAEARYSGTGGPPLPMDGLPVAVKEEAPITGQRNTFGSLPLRRRRRAHGALRPAHHRRGRHRACQVDNAGVLLRTVHLDEALGRHPQPVEHRLLPRRLERRVRRCAGGRLGDPGDRVGYRRLDQDPGLVLRRRRVQAALRARSRGRDLQSRPLLP